MKITTPKEKALAKVRAAQKRADIVSKAFGPPSTARPPSGNVAAHGARSLPMKRGPNG